VGAEQRAEVIRGAKAAALGAVLGLALLALAHRHSC
jgi:hypothetical protein